jgi:hypothetical protein
MPKKLSDIEFAQLFQSIGPTQLSHKTGTSVRNIFERRKRLEARLGVVLTAPTTLAPRSNTTLEATGLPEGEAARSMHEDFKDGVVLIGGDGQYWPGKASTAHRALVYMAKQLKPKIIVFNGDAVDGATISRHPPIGWENLPSLADELAVVQERLGEIWHAAPKAKHIWPLGNHDARFNTRLATVASEFSGIEGTRLVHHFPDWEPCWSVFIGGERGCVIKHRFKGGIHATHNNALWAGRTLVSNHLHSLKVTPLTDYNGTRWGVDCGCLANTLGAQFNYAEDNPRNWRGGFAVLTWHKGELLWPEIVSVHDESKGLVNWRGALIRV